MAAVTSLTLATRRSALALQQAQCVAEALQTRCGIRVQICPVVSRGDEITDRPLAEVGGKGLFVKALQEAIAAGRADAAVHSLKDMEARPTPGFTLAAVGFAAARHDIVVGAAGGLDKLPAGARVGTCSPRRSALLRRHYPALQAVSIRGNVHTRLDKLHAGEVDALLLAAAALERLDLMQHCAAALPLQQFIPAPGQGLLGLECMAENTAVQELLAAVGDASLQRCATAERAFAAAMGGDCHTALGAYATLDGAQVHLHAFYAEAAEQGGAFHETTARAAAPHAAAATAAATIRQQCG